MEHKIRKIQRYRAPQAHKWSKNILRRVGELFGSNNYNGFIELAEDWMVILSSIWTTMWFWEQSTAGGIVMYLLCAAIIGARMRAFGSLLHQSSHGVLASNKFLNYFLGTFCSGYFIFQCHTIYTKNHLPSHHPFLGDERIDPDYQEYIRNGLCGKNRSSNNARDYLLSLFSPMRSYVYLKYIFILRIYNPSEPTWERLARMLFFGFWIVVIISKNIWFQVLVFWMVPFVTTHVWVGSLLEMSEHYPMIDGIVPRVDILMTRNRKVNNRFADFFLGIHSEGYHLVHHLFPHVAAWNYAAVHEILMEDELYSSLDHSEKGWRHLVENMIAQADMPTL